MQQTIIDQTFDLTGILIDTELKNNPILQKYAFTLPPEYKRNLQLSSKECIHSLIACDQTYLLSYKMDQTPACKKQAVNLIEFQKNMPLIQTICKDKAFKDSFLHVTKHILNIEIKKHITNDQINDLQAKIQLASSMESEKDLLLNYQSSLQYEEKMLQARQNDLIEKMHQQLKQNLSSQNTKDAMMAIVPTLTASITLMVAQDTIDQVLESVYPTNLADHATTMHNRNAQIKVKSLFWGQVQRDRIKSAVSQNDGSYEKEILRLKKQLTEYLSEDVIGHAISQILPFEQFGTQSQDAIMAAQKSFKACITAPTHNLELCRNQATMQNTSKILDIHLSQLIIKLSPQRQTAKHLLDKATNYFNFILDSIKKVDPQKILNAKQKTLANVQVCLGKLNQNENAKIFRQMTNACVTLGIMDFYDQISKNYIDKFQILHKKAEIKDIQHRQTNCQEKIKQNLIGNNYASYKSKPDDMIKRLSLSQLDLITSVQTQLHECQLILEKDLSKIDLPFIRN